MTIGGRRHRQTSDERNRMMTSALMAEQFETRIFKLNLANRVCIKQRSTNGIFSAWSVWVSPAEDPQILECNPTQRV
jgi:hypothetical protein